MIKNKIFKFLSSFFIFFLATSFFILLAPQYSYAEESDPGSPEETVSGPTYVTEDIIEDTTWSLANSPYIIQNDIDVYADATLTIEPGVVIKFIPPEVWWGGIEINVYGKLIANGEEDNKIYFTSNYDDEVGGNTDDEEFCYDNFDENDNDLEQICETYDLGDPFMGDWRGIYFSDSTGSTFKNVSFRYAYSTLIFLSSSVNFENLDISDSESGLTGYYDSHVEILGGTLNNLKEAIVFFEDSFLVLEDVIISNVTYYDAIVIFNNSSLILSNVNISHISRGDGIVIFNSSTLNATQLSIDNISRGDALVIFNDSSVSITGGVIKDSFGDGLVLFNYSMVSLDNVTIENLSGIALLDFGNRVESLPNSLSISNSIIKNNIIGVKFRSPTTVFFSSNNSIFGNLEYGVFNYFLGANYNFENTWWGDASGPYHPELNPEGLGDEVSDNVLFDPWCIDEDCTPPLPPCEIDCFSNVLFLPGLMGSRLYEEGLDCGTDIVGSECGDQELWISISGSSQKKLLLDVNGKSINNLYTKNDTQKLDEDDGETGIVDEILVFNIYKSFIADLQSWKQDEIIEDYDFIPYDWRLSLEDIITNGSVSEDGDLSYDVSQDFSESFILKKLEELQASSKSGKVTIVAHSNGGLVAKALVQKLQDTNNSLYDKIDKIIFVAVPQIGTPDAVVALLHGTKLGSGFVMKNDMSRELAENMSTVYNLLPSVNYFTTVDPAFAIDKIVSFENNPFFNPQTEQYGVYVSNPTELENYILGTDSRTKPEFGDVKHPNIGNSFLYNQAKIIHQMLDDWAPSAETKVIQVAGWGEETISGLDYRVKKNGDNESLTYKPRFVIDGDGTVVVPSALWMSDSEPNVERWWVDLKKEGGPFSLINRHHRDILEISNLRDFIKSKIKNTEFSDTENIVVNNTDTLNSSDERRLHFTLHSPLTLGIVDAEGRYTGLDPVTLEIRQEIPGVTYRQIGEVQFLSVPDGIAYTLKLQGYEDGFFSLDVDEQQGNEITDSILFEGIESSTSTFVTLEITPSGEVSTSELKIDSDGDGDTDKAYQITDNGELLITNVAQAVETPITSSRGKSSYRPKVVVNQPKDEIKKEETMVEDKEEVIKNVVIVTTPILKEKAVKKVAVVVPEKAPVVTIQDKPETKISQIKPEVLSASSINSGVNVGFWGTMKMFVSSIFSWW